MPQGLKDKSPDKSGERVTLGASVGAELPSWVRQHESRASQKSKPEFVVRQRQKSIGANPSVAPLSQSEKLLTVAEAAWLLNLSEKTVRRLIEAKNLAVIRIGRSIRIHPQVIEKIERQNE